MFLKPKEIIANLALSNGMVVGDFGIGSGEFSLEMSKQVDSEGKVYAIDIQELVLKKTQQHFLELNIKNVEFIHGDLEIIGGTKLADKSLDLVLLSNIFFQVENNENLIKEALRVVKDNGRIVVIDWKSAFAGIGPAQELIFSEEQALQLFAKFNIPIITHLKHVGNYHYGLVFRKP